MISTAGTSKEGIMACFMFWAMIVAFIGIDTVWIDEEED